MSDAPFSLQSKIKSFFSIYYLCFAKSRGAEVFKIRLASSLRSISKVVFSAFKQVTKTVSDNLYSKVYQT